MRVDDGVLRVDALLDLGQDLGARVTLAVDNQRHIFREVGLYPGEERANVADQRASGNFVLVATHDSTSSVLYVRDRLGDLNDDKMRPTTARIGPLTRGS